MPTHRICILPLGFEDERLLEHIRSEVEGTFRFPASCLSPKPIPSVAFNPARSQYLSTAILRGMPDMVPGGTWKTLSVTEADLYVQNLTYVFGEAMVDGEYSVISVARLRPEFYGHAPDEGLFLRRAIIEAVHELGHTFGLHHCPIERCAMFFSSDIEDTDRKSPMFCGKCRDQLAAKFSTLDSAA